MSILKTAEHRDDSPQGLLLVGHGTRDAAGLQELREVAQLLAAACPQAIVEHAFLELAEPTIAQAIARCAQRGVKRLVVQPLLLFAAGHAKRDIPEEVKQAAGGYPQLEVTLAPHLGCHPRLLELSELRFAEAIFPHPPVSDADTLLLMVGRGSRDAEANCEMACFSRLRWERRPLGWVETCFTAMTRPTLAEGLTAAAVLAQRRVVVQPHLLFQGELLSRVRAEAAAAAARHPRQQWIITNHLGPHPLLIEALLQISGLSSGTPERLPESLVKATFNRSRGG